MEGKNSVLQPKKYGIFYLKHPKDLDPSYKIFGILLEGKKLCLINEEILHFQRMMNRHNSFPCLYYKLHTVENQWLKQAWDNESLFQSKEVPASQSKFSYKLNSRDPSSINETATVRDFVLFFSFSILSDRLKIGKEIISRKI